MSSSIPSSPPLHLPPSSLSLVTISDCVIFFLPFTVSLFSLCFDILCLFPFLSPSLAIFSYSVFFSFTTSAPYSFSSAPTLSE